MEGLVREKLEGKSMEEPASPLEDAEASRKYFEGLYLQEKRIREAIQRIRQSVDTDEVLSNLVREVGTALNVDRCFVVEFDEDENPLPVQHYYGSSDAVGSFLGLTPPWFFCPYFKRVSKHELAFTQDAFEDPSVGYDPRWYHFSREHNIHGAMAVPILFDGKLLNCLTLHTIEPHPWSEEEVFFVQTLANHIAPTVYQAKLAKNLKQSAELKGLFLANMSHELKTPLTSILGYTGLLLRNRENHLSGKELRHLENIQSSGQHLLDLINTILDFTQAEAQRITLAPQLFDVIPLMEEVQTIVKPHAEEKGIQLFFNVPQQLDAIDADPVRLKQILINLISNAIKFNRPYGSVHVDVSLSADRQHIHFSVKDTGMGIPQQHFSRLFTEFYQVDPNFSRKNEGLGLGLALCKRLVDLHQGKLTMESEENKGSTFTVSIPTFYRQAA